METFYLEQFYLQFLPKYTLKLNKFYKFSSEAKPYLTCFKFHPLPTPPSPPPTKVVMIIAIEWQSL